MERVITKQEKKVLEYLIDKAKGVKSFSQVFVTLSEIADFLGVSRAAVVVILQRLENKRIITRRVSGQGQFIGLSRVYDTPFRVKGLKKSVIFKKTDETGEDAGGIGGAEKTEEITHPTEPLKGVEEPPDEVGVKISNTADVGVAEMVSSSVAGPSVEVAKENIEVEQQATPTVLSGKLGEIDKLLDRLWQYMNDFPAEVKKEVEPLLGEIRGGIKEYTGVHLWRFVYDRVSKIKQILKRRPQ